MAEAIRAYGEDAGHDSPGPGRAGTPARAYTYRDYLSWGEDVRCELIEGMVYMLAAPLEWHQFTAGEIHWQLKSWLKGKTCRVHIAPYDVRLFARADEDDRSDTTVVQPDVLVICDPKKRSDGKACRGAPDFVVEVSSRGTRSKDFHHKRALYERAGVTEYWIVDADDVYRYVLTDGVYSETVHELDEWLELEVGVLPGCRISFEEIAVEARSRPAEGR